MSVLNIPTALGSVLSSLSSHHKKGIHGGGAGNPLSSTPGASASTDAQPAGSAQSLFGTLLDSVEQVVGIHSVNPPASANAPHAGAVTPASISAAQAAMKKS